MYIEFVSSAFETFHYRPIHFKILNFLYKTENMTFCMREQCLRVS